MSILSSALICFTTKAKSSYRLLKCQSWLTNSLSYLQIILGIKMKALQNNRKPSSFRLRTSTFGWWNSWIFNLWMLKRIKNTWNNLRFYCWSMLLKTMLKKSLRIFTLYLFTTFMLICVCCRKKWWLMKTRPSSKTHRNNMKLRGRPFTKRKNINTFWPTKHIFQIWFLAQISLWNQ